MIPYTVYVVDDDLVLQRMLTMTLGKKYEIKAFSEALPAIASIEKDTPDLILLDIYLPDMNGIDALGDIRKRYPNSEAHAGIVRHIECF